LRNAARSPDAIMRVQAAAVARHLPREEAENILPNALDDSDSGVRNFALKSIKAMAAMPAAIQTKIKTLSTSDPEQFIREISSDLLRMETPSR
jgi:hypothetical protein